jgi:hypothetical protein
MNRALRHSSAPGNPLTLIVGLVALTGFACSTKSPGSPPPSTETTSSGLVTTVGSGGGGGSTNAGGAGGSGGIAPGAICPPGEAWDVGAIVDEVSSPSGEIIASVTPDETSLAWVEPAAGTAIIHYVDRGDLSMPFGFPQDLIGASLDPIHGIALSQDGLRLVTVLAGGLGFVEYTRAYRGEPFAKPTSAPYQSINAIAAQQPGLTFADPVLSGNDGVFIYSQFAGITGPTVFESQRIGLEPWPVGVSLSGPLLTMVEGKRRRPTGLSADLRSLFYHDDVSGQLRVAFRSESTGQFTSAFDINAGISGQANNSCTRLYYTGQKDGKTRVWVTGLKP